MVAAGVLGLPPTNGVLPQAPMHTHALSVRVFAVFFYLSFFYSLQRNFEKGKTHSLLFSSLFLFLSPMQVAAGERARKVAAAAQVEEAQAEAEAEAAAAEAAGNGGLRQRRQAAAPKKKEAPTGASSSALPPPPPPPSHHHLEPLETRVASLLQYLAILACAFAGPLLRQIPRGAIAGYFAFMSLEWVGDSEMVDRVRWLLSDAAGRASVRR